MHSLSFFSVYERKRKDGDCEKPKEKGKKWNTPGVASSLCCGDDFGGGEKVTFAFAFAQSNTFSNIAAQSMRNPSINVFIYELGSFTPNI